MAYEAYKCGLEIELRRFPTTTDRVTNSLNIFWRLMELMPIWHRTYKDKEGITFWYVKNLTFSTANSDFRPHLCRGRIRAPGQTVHRTAREIFGADEGVEWEPPEDDVPTHMSNDTCRCGRPRVDLGT